ncbi:MAG: helix-hairpin-helix domain-containing protein [Armatimonadetes bacterium]|nr:helix-hairpin-helix domain-containing protein [Armatimonadota bacterium]
MFYLSRAERGVLYTLLVLLLSGAGVLAYAKGRNAARVPGALFVPAPEESAEKAPATKEAESPPETRSVGVESQAESKTLATAPCTVCLNQATAEELDSLPGIGPVYAASIVAYREKKWREKGCGFESVDELLNVPGIGPKRFEAIRDLVAP